MDLDLQSVFGLMCTALLIGWDPATPPPALVRSVQKMTSYYAL